MPIATPMWSAGWSAGDLARCALSFSPDIAVATPDGGEQAIGTLKVGDQVTAYDPQTGQASTQTVEHVWINHDTDLIDLTLQVASDSTAQASADASGKQKEVDLAAHGLRAPPADAQAAKQAQDARESQTDAADGAGRSKDTDTRATDETVHTTAKHPWLTADRDWVKAGELRLGEQVVRLDGTTAVVAAEHAVPGAANYYNLEVSHLHTFAVGAGRYVVHNCGSLGEVAHRTAGDLMAALPQYARKSTTVAVGIFKDGDAIRTFVSMNRSGLEQGFGSRIMNMVGKDAWIEGSKHAEVNILESGACERYSNIGHSIL